MTTFAELVALDLPALSSLLAAGEPPVDALDPPEWLGVAFQINALVLAADADAEPRDWAVRCRAVEHAAAAVHATGLEDDIAHLTRRLNNSAAMLARTRPRADVALLDPDAMLDRLFRSLPMTADESRRRAVHWRDLPLPQILELRKVKNLLTPGLAIARHAPVPRFEADVRAWSAVRPLLP
ncbi:hypothetical protein [Cellulomonas cellasea]|uniref:Uncharacterized protein n=2 Tax=Cellulomonas cellasea TaxID=43670 RepID=A0A0A0B776_9CELL|nr:hypothetical protein [Cellulomonas cellasea]KGM02002.1 hypothetical protein Q760_16100 [Cellulomonas cellasea DSM 20118]GEA90105.1 hypothetical protein CCE01nite_40540 [Cellulomonas cellasea]